MPPTRRSSRRDNDDPRRNSQNQPIDEVEFQNVFLFLFGVYAFAAVLSRNAVPRAANSDVNISVYRSRANNRVDRTARPAARAIPPAPAVRAGPLAPAARAGPLAPAARAIPPAPAVRAGPLAPAARAGPLAPAARAGPLAPAARAGPLAPAARAGPLAPAARAGPLAPAARAAPSTAPVRAVPPALPARAGPLAPAARAGPLAPAARAAPSTAPVRAVPPALPARAAAPNQPRPLPQIPQNPAPRDRDAAHHQRQNYDPNEIIHELGGFNRGTLDHAEEVRSRGVAQGSLTLMHDVLCALHGIPNDMNEIHNREIVEVGDHEENAVALVPQGQRARPGVAPHGAVGGAGENWFQVDEPGCYPAHMDRMGPQFAPFRQGLGPAPPRQARPPAPGQPLGNGILDVVVMNADGESDPNFAGVNAGRIIPADDNGPNLAPYEIGDYSEIIFTDGEEEDEDWDSVIITGNVNEIIEISDDEGAPVANNNTQGVRGREVAPPRSTKRNRSSSGSPSSRATKRSRIDNSPPPPRRGGSRRPSPRNRSPRAGAAPAPRAPSGLPSPPESQALTRRQGAQAGLPENAVARPYARPARFMNYVPEDVGNVRDSFDPLYGPVRDFNTMTDLEKTYLALDYCSGTHSRYGPMTEINYRLGLSRDMSYCFSLQVVAYRNGDVETCKNAVEFFKCHPLHMAGSTKMSHCIATSQLPRKPPRVYSDEELRKCCRTIREERELIREPSTPGYAGSEYPRPHSVLRYKVTKYSQMDKWEFQLWNAEAAGPTIFSLRSAYKAATYGDCLLTARLSYEGKEIAQCSMSALEDRQRGFVHEDGVAMSPHSYGSLMSIGRDLPK